MTVHVYKEDTKIVLMGWIKVWRANNELRHMELSLQTAEVLLSRLSKKENPLGLKAEKLLELIHNRRQDTSEVVLASSKDKVNRTLVALSKAAWQLKVPYSVDETDAAGEHESFDAYATVYSVRDGSGE